VTQGIILREHTPYYVQEIAAPPGYELEDAKHWFLFCEEKDTDGNYQTECTYQTGIEGIKKIPGDKVGVFNLTNLQSMYELPETGGMGTTSFYIVGSIMVAAAVALLAIKKRIGAEG
jgi:LPXTG-motif cell wall-anchored protein